MWFHWPCSSPLCSLFMPTLVGLATLRPHRAEGRPCGGARRGSAASTPPWRLHSHFQPLFSICAKSALANWMIWPPFRHLGGRRRLVSVTDSPCPRAEPLCCVSAVHGAKGPQLGGSCRQWKSSGPTGPCDVWQSCVNLYKVAFAKAASTWIWFWKEEIILPPYCRLHHAYCILRSGHLVPEASRSFSAADKIVPFVSPCSSLTYPLPIPSASLWHLNFCRLSQCMGKPLWKI